MPSNKQRRQAAQRHLQRQLERRAEEAKKRRRNLLIGVTVLAVVIVAGGAFFIAGIGGDDAGDATDANASSAATEAPADEAPTDEAPTPGPGAERVGQTVMAGPCTFTYDAQGSAGAPVDAPTGDIPTDGTEALTMTTNQGVIGLTLDPAGAPCAAASFEALTEQGFFDGTPCHRLTTSDSLQVLQCGDPSGAGTGGPGYSYPTQTTGSETYPRGTLAMANSGQGTDGSQFFLVYGDSQLQPDYTVVGTIDDAGLAVLDQIAAAGAEGGAPDGAPVEPVTIESMTAAG